MDLLWSGPAGKALEVWHKKSYESVVGVSQEYYKSVTTVLQDGLH
jgi:hypothetical protein